MDVVNYIFQRLYCRVDSRILSSGGYRGSLPGGEGDLPADRRRPLALPLGRNHSPRCVHVVVCMRMWRCACGRTQLLLAVPSDLNECVSPCECGR
jgi:hypothetical protein